MTMKAGFGTRPKVQTASTSPIDDILKLDGRKRAPRARTLPLPSQPPKVKSVKLAIEQFLKQGESGRHSSGAILLRYILAYCEAHNIGYVLQRWVVAGRPAGYYIKRFDVDNSPFLEKDAQ